MVEHFKARMWLADNLGRTVSDLDDMPVAEFSMIMLWHAERSQK